MLAIKFKSWRFEGQMVSKTQFSLTKKTDTSCELFFCKDLRFCESTPLVEPCNTNLIFNTKSVGNF